ncbi:hypothetical protein BKA62DRAFT_698419 [Auriculariales sp. MPI-PUGE-AT-0066]|nr:hypothetical protein BKA62DRAFT_698419 [Auriculariales sp. MPI-PUGE-AT-0066]
MHYQPRAEAEHPRHHHLNAFRGGRRGNQLGSSSRGGSGDRSTSQRGRSDRHPRPNRQASTNSHRSAEYSTQVSCSGWDVPAWDIVSSSSKSPWGGQPAGTESVSGWSTSSTGQAPGWGDLSSSASAWTADGQDAGLGDADSNASSPSPAVSSSATAIVTAETTTGSDDIHVGDSPPLSAGTYEMPALSSATWKTSDTSKALRWGEAKTESSRSLADEAGTSSSTVSEQAASTPGGLEPLRPVSKELASSKSATPTSPKRARRSTPTSPKRARRPTPTSPKQSSRSTRAASPVESSASTSWSTARRTWGAPSDSQDYRHRPSRNPRDDNRRSPASNKWSHSRSRSPVHKRTRRSPSPERRQDRGFVQNRYRHRQRSPPRSGSRIPEGRWQHREPSPMWEHSRSSDKRPDTDRHHHLSCEPPRLPNAKHQDRGSSGGPRHSKHKGQDHGRQQAHRRNESPARDGGWNQTRVDNTPKASGSLSSGWGSADSTGGWGSVSASSAWSTAGISAAAGWGDADISLALLPTSAPSAVSAASTTTRQDSAPSPASQWSVAKQATDWGDSDSTVVSGSKSATHHANTTQTCRQTSIAGANHDPSSPISRSSTDSPLVLPETSAARRRLIVAALPDPRCVSVEKLPPATESSTSTALHPQSSEIAASNWDKLEEGEVSTDWSSRQPSQPRSEDGEVPERRTGCRLRACSTGGDAR